jgi:ribonuclease Z
MIDNAAYQSLQHAGLTIEGYSRALVQSVWRLPELNLGFDAGAMPWRFLDTPVWFITHAHLDHLAALPVLVSRRAIMDLPIPTTIYVPEPIVDQVWEMLRTWEKLDHCSMSCTLKGVAAGDEVAVSRDHFVRAYAMHHPVPALGYIVWERRHKLKPEFQGLPGDRIRDLKLGGVAVTEEQRLPLIGYTGDTRPEGLDDNSDFFAARVLITEMSFVRVNHPREKIHGYGHMHIDDFVERAEKFRNELLIVAHISSRYEIDEAKDAVAKHMPAGLRERMHVWG